MSAPPLADKPHTQEALNRYLFNKQPCVLTNKKGESTVCYCVTPHNQQMSYPLNDQRPQDVSQTHTWQISQHITSQKATGRTFPEKSPVKRGRQPSARLGARALSECWVYWTRMLTAAYLPEPNMHTAQCAWTDGWMSNI